MTPTMLILCPKCKTQLSVPRGTTQCKCSVCGQLINIEDVDATRVTQMQSAVPPGASMGQPFAGPSPQSQPQMPQQPYPYQQSKSNNSTVIAVLATLLAAIVGAGVVYFFIHQDKSEASAETQAPAVVHDTVVQTQTIVHEVPVQTTSQPQAQATPPRSASGQGLYPFASTRRLSASELQAYSAWDLKIMRNEIYARHGYIFQTADMKNYFNSQSWYRPVSRNVKLTSIEQANVATIQRVEATK
ncbi:MAG: YARHG domain-containing protein [Bacteroidaceae bacterium]|nr:YARHG domain-containing protein [Bacteroidaceae bacterium]